MMIARLARESCSRMRKRFWKRQKDDAEYSVFATDLMTGGVKG